MEEIIPGMPVVDADGALGTLESIAPDGTGSGATIVVRRRQSVGTFVVGRYSVADGVLHVDDAGTEAGYLSEQRPALAESATVASGNTVIDLPAGEELIIPVIQEQARIETRVVQRGGVRVHKTVSSREEVFEQPLMHEEVSVERVTIGQVVDIAPQARREGDTLIVPVLEEVTVVNTQLVLVEEVRITRHQTRAIEQVPVVLRTEHVTIENIPDPRASV